MTSQPTTAPLLEMRGIVKRFPGVLALGGSGYLKTTPSGDVVRAFPYDG